MRQVKFKDKPVNLVGPEIKVGDKAPNFECVEVLDLVTLASTPAKARLFSVVPSLDTGVCNKQTHHFDTAIAAMKDQVAAYTISLDMPFAQKRFCTTENISNFKTYSDLHNFSFGKAYGVLLEGLPIPLLTARSSSSTRPARSPMSSTSREVTNEPNYEKALAALKAAV